MESTIKIRARTNGSGWEDAELVAFLPRRVKVRLADRRIVVRRRDDIQMSDIDKAKALAFGAYEGYKALQNHKTGERKKRRKSRK